MPQATSFAPLGVLGYCLMRTGFLRPLWTEVTLPLKVVDHTLEAKLIAVLVSLLAGCRAISQVNTRLRPDVALAQAWGVPTFAEQSALARTLDAFGPTQVTQLQQGSQTWFRSHSRTGRHDFEQAWLWLDIDLTPLPASKHAEASAKGRLGKKTAMVANWRACMPHSITRLSSRASIRATKRAPRPTSPSCRSWRRCWA
jgi:hypothetical protein